MPIPPKLKKEILLFTKYGIVGFLGTVVDFSALYILVEYGGISIIVSTTIAFLLAVVNNFILNKIWTFKNRSKNYISLFTKFLLVSMGGLIINNLSMLFQIKVLGLWYMYAKFFTAFLVPLWNYMGNKYYTFTKQKNIPFQSV